MGSDEGFLMVDPGGNGIAFTEAYAWVTVHSDDDESITGVGGRPLMMQQRDLAERFTPLMQTMAKGSGKRQKLVRLQMVEVIKVVEPDGQ